MWAANLTKLQSLNPTHNPPSPSITVAQQITDSAFFPLVKCGKEMLSAFETHKVEHKSLGITCWSFLQCFLRQNIHGSTTHCAIRWMLVPQHIVYPYFSNSFNTISYQGWNHVFNFFPLLSSFAFAQSHFYLHKSKKYISCSFLILCHHSES